MLIIGGSFTYTNAPLFDLIKELFGLNRNYYDRFGHIVQGMVVSAIIYDLLSSWRIVEGKIQNFIILSTCLSLSALFEIFEMLMCKIFQDKQEIYLALQSDFWDTQNDMLMSIIGWLIWYYAIRNYHAKGSTWNN